MNVKHSKSTVEKASGKAKSAGKAVRTKITRRRASSEAVIAQYLTLPPVRRWVQFPSVPRPPIECPASRPARDGQASASPVRQEALQPGLIRMWEGKLPDALEVAPQLLHALAGVKLLKVSRGEIFSQAQIISAAESEPAPTRRCSRVQGYISGVVRNQ